MSSTEPIFWHEQSSHPALAVSHPPAVHPVPLSVHGLGFATHASWLVQPAVPPPPPTGIQSATATEPSPARETATIPNPRVSTKLAKNFFKYISILLLRQYRVGNNVQNEPTLVGVIDKTNNTLMKEARLVWANLELEFNLFRRTDSYV